MLNLPAGTQIWLVAGVTDMRNHFQGLAAKVESRYRLTHHDASAIFSSNGIPDFSTP